jgi:hypothetical protein
MKVQEQVRQYLAKIGKKGGESTSTAKLAAAARNGAKRWAPKDLGTVRDSRQDSAAMSAAIRRATAKRAKQ